MPPTHKVSNSSMEEIYTKKEIEQISSSTGLSQGIMLQAYILLIYA